MTHRGAVTVRPRVFDGRTFPFKVSCRAETCPFLVFSDEWPEAVAWAQFHTEKHN